MLRRGLYASSMRTLLAVLFLTLAWMFTWLPASYAANPLTRAERQICSSLRHCVSILERHTQDNFNYHHLAEAFGHYGTRGRKALIRVLDKGGPEAAQAADLIAISRNSKLLPLLEDYRSQTKDPELVERTIEALTRRLQSEKQSILLPPFRLPELQAGQHCDLGEPIKLGAQKGEMPFFEADIARPDNYGAYRPSADFRLALHHAGRPDLTSAVSIFGGWLAGYSGGLVHYDSKTGQPSLLSRAPILTVQRMEARLLGRFAWVVSTAPDQIIISRASADKMVSLLSLDSALSDLRRTTDDRLVIVTKQGVTAKLNPDGTYDIGCTP